MDKTTGIIEANGMNNIVWHFPWNLQMKYTNGMNEPAVE